jgi:uncharacterized membrane protein YgcG
VAALAVAGAVTLGLLAALTGSSTAATPPSLVSLVASVVGATGLAQTTPTGTVTFTVDLKTVATVPLVNGVAELSTALLGSDAHAVVAVYSGDSTHTPGVTVSNIPASAGEVGLTIEVSPVPAARPLVSILRPADGTHYAEGQVVDASYSCTDANGPADITGCAGPVTVGDPVDTSTAGSHSFTVDAQNEAGLMASTTASYFVDPAPAQGVSTQAASGATSPAATPPPRPGPATSAPATPQVRSPPARAARRASPAKRARGRHRARRRGPAAIKPVERASPAPRAAELVAYDPKSQPAKVVRVEVGAFTLLAMAGSLGLAAAGTGGGSGGGGSGGGGSGGGGSGGGGSGGGGGAASNINLDYDGLDLVFLAGVAGVAIGDRSFTWRWPGTARLDTATAALPGRLAVRAPLLARLGADGIYLRSILGSAALIVEVAGLALGVVAVEQTNGHALPPSLWLTIAIAVVGVIDAAAGLLALAAFAIGVLVLGGLDSGDAVRTLLGLAGLWFAVPLLAGAARPLRRERPSDAKQRFDRAADFVIASLIGAYAVDSIVTALPGLSGYNLPIASHATLISLVVLGALVVRMLGETASSHYYPRRLGRVHHGELAGPGTVHRLGAALLRTAIFTFVAVLIVGESWQLWVAGLLFIVPQLVDVFEERLPKSARIGRLLPEGLLGIVLILFVTAGLGALLLSLKSKSELADSFVILATPGALLAILSGFGEEREEHEASEIGWAPRVAGTVLLALGVLEVLGYLFQS